LKRVQELIDALEQHYVEPAEHAAATGRQAKAKLRALGGHLSSGIPRWVPAPLTHRLHALIPELPAEPGRVGEALGVVVLQDRQAASLVRVRVHIEQAPRATRQPPPAGVSAQTLDAMYGAVLTVARLYPVHWAVDPMRDVRFEVRGLDRAPLDLSAPIRGGSLALATLVATWSRLAERAPCYAVWTGALGMQPTGGRPHTPVLEVGEIPAKRGEARQSRGTFVVPAACAEAAGDGAETVSSAQDAIVRAFGPGWFQDAHPPPRYDAGVALEHLDQAYRRNGSGSSWATIEARFSRFEAQKTGLSVEQRVLALARSGACYSHMGAIEPAITRLQEARALAKMADPTRLDAGIEVLTLTHLCVVLRDQYRFTEAERAAREAVALGRSTRHTVDTINAESTLGQLLVVTDRVAEGIKLVQGARDYYVGRHSYESPRNHTYMVTALARARRYDDAEREYRLGCDHNLRWAEAAQVPNNQAYLDLAWLDARLRRLRAAVESDDTWEALHRDATASIEAFGGNWWPGPGLLRVRDAAALRVTPDQRDAVVTRVQQRIQGALEGPYPDELMAWQHALVLLEAARVAGDDRASRDLAQRAIQHAPPTAAQGWFQGHIAAVEAAVQPSDFVDALDRLIEAEPY
jgi:hypothetical protein